MHTFGWDFELKSTDSRCIFLSKPLYECIGLHMCNELYRKIPSTENTESTMDGLDALP